MTIGGPDIDQVNSCGISFVSKLTVADGEQNETQHWVEVALDCTYISEETSAGLLQQCKDISNMLNSMILKSNSFCIYNNPKKNLGYKTKGSS